MKEINVKGMYNTAAEQKKMKKGIDDHEPISFHARLTIAFARFYSTIKGKRPAVENAAKEALNAESGIKKVEGIITTLKIASESKELKQDEEAHLDMLRVKKALMELAIYSQNTDIGRAVVMYAKECGDRWVINYLKMSDCHDTAVLARTVEKELLNH